MYPDLLGAELESVTFFDDEDDVPPSVEDGPPDPPLALYDML